ncbi:universal stress protein [Natrialbaceae archaeon A-gly3]
MCEILLAVDDSESRARAQAETIADLPLEPDGLSVTILHVFSDNPTGASVQQVSAAREVHSQLAEHGIDSTLNERSGEPATQILSYAEEKDVGLICLAGRKRTPTGKALFGSVTQDVILSTDRPVLVSSDTPGTE